MANGSSTINDLTNLIAKLRQEYTEVKERLSEIEHHLSAVETTMHLFRGKGVSHETILDVSLMKELQGKTHIQALLIIAAKNNNHLKVVDAKRLMLEAGLIRRPKNALSMLYTQISRSEKFEKVAPGEYRLVESQPNPSSSLTSATDYRDEWRTEKDV